MNENEYVPTLTDIWDFLVGFKEATQAGFVRVDARLDSLAADVSVLKSDVSRLDRDLQRVERRVIRLDDHMSAMEDQRIAARLDDHERRIMRLEQQPT